MTSTSHAQSPGSLGQLSQAQRFELLIDSIADYAICMLDAQGFVTSWHAGAERINGYKSSEIIGRHFSRFFTAEDQASGVPSNVLQAASSEGRHEAEGWRVRKDGSRFRANTITQLVRDQEGAVIGFAEIMRDITERLEAQNAILESERQFHILVDGVLDYALYMLDPSGVVINWNAGAERLKGYAADEILGQHFSRFYTKEDRAAGLPARALEVAAREGHYESEGWRVRKDGSRFWASVAIDPIRDEAGSLQGFAKLTHDDSERRAALEALRESERQFRMLVGGVSDYALYMLDPNGIVTSWNAGGERIKGYSSEEIIGQHFSRFYTERDRAAGVPTRALLTAMHEPRFEAEGWRVRKDGTMFWANVVMHAIRDEQGDLVGFAKITRDITERREAQLALQEAQIERAHAQKIDALGQLTGGVAHDFNNLLMVVSGHVQTIKRAVASDQKLTRAAQAIEQAAERGEALTRQLLTFSRRQAINPAVCRINDRVEAFRTMLSSLIGGTIKLVTTVGPELWPIKVDPSEFELALVNLVLNARDAMPHGGVVSLTAENVRLSKRNVPAGLEGEFVALRVSDSGCGIAPDVLPKVFDPFFTTKATSKGSGLGLSQVHGFAHQSGGTVTIESELGRGTAVTLYLPRSSENPAVPAGAAQVETAVGGNVLVVEDNPDVRDVAVSMLEQLGYETQAAPDAAAALQVLEQGSFDLVISDIVMPGELDGRALARAIRERKPDLPVLLVTGYSPEGRADADFPLLRKPFQFSELSHTVARLIAEAKQPPDSNLVRLSAARRSAAAVKGEGK